MSSISDLKYFDIMYAFGSNGESQLGLPASDKVLTPTKLDAYTMLARPYKVHGGGNHTLLLHDTSVFGAGCNQAQQLGPEPDVDENNRVTKFTRLYESIDFCAAAWESSAYIRGGASPTLYTEGRGHHGELGRGELNNTSGDDFKCQPTGITVPEPVVDFAAGMYHYVAVLSNGGVWGWGRAKNGQLGETSLKSFNMPIPIQRPSFKAERVTCGQNFTYFVSSPDIGQHVVLGDDKHGVKSKMPDNVKDWEDIGATWNAIFVLFKDGSLKAWGKEDLWQLVPPNLPKIGQIAVGSDHILALTMDGKVLSWGWATHGNCGDTSKLDKSLLVKGYITGGWNEINFPGNVRKIGAGYSTSFVITREHRGYTKG